MLKTDYKDDVLNTDANVNRKFSIVRSNGTVVEQNVELRETTAFKQTGDSFGAKDINATNTAINDVTSKLQNLQIGGRNYLVGSNVKANSPNQSAIASISDINSLNQNLGKPITLSIRYTAKNWTGRSLGFEMGFNYEDGTTLYYSIWIHGSVDGNKTLSATYILPIEHGKIKSIDEVPAVYVQDTTAGTATVYQPKLELGNIATDWTPAPEDLMDTPITNSDIDTILNS